MAPIPITIVTGFLGSGKTTLILKLLPQLPAGYKVALVKNEFGDVAVDSKLASTAAVSGVRELLNGCICCNLVGQLGDALAELTAGGADGGDARPPDRFVLETSGSAFPATLALEVNRLAAETGGAYVLDGVVSVIDVENWRGYDDTSYTARLQAKYTDLIVFNKWEAVSERRFEECEDRVLDLDVDVPRIKSDRGFVPYDVLVGLDSGLARAAGLKEADANGAHGHGYDRDGEHHQHDHQSEVNVLSVRIAGDSSSARGLDVGALDKFLRSAPKEDFYRIKAVFWASDPPLQSDGQALDHSGPQQYILNWAFGRWTITPFGTESRSTILEMTIITARDEATKCRKKIEAEEPFKLSNGKPTDIKIERVS